MITLDEWGYPIVDPGPLPPGLERHARKAVNACPTLALRLLRTETAKTPRAKVKPILISNGPRLTSIRPSLRHRGHLDTPRPPEPAPQPLRLLITFDHFFAFLSVLTTFSPDLSDFCGQN